MFDVQTNWPALLDFMENPVFRAWIVASGLVAAGHYHAMANASGRAPLLIKYLVLPLLTGSGIGMAWAGLTGNAAAIGIYSGAAAGLMVIINVSAWSAGAYVSAMFERAAILRERIRKDGNLFVADIRSMADAVNIPDSEAAALEKERERQP